MRVTQLLENTRREAPSGADIVSYGIMEKAGYIRQLSSGIFIYMHLAWRSLRKIEQIIREEMDRIGGVEMNMPVVHPADPWKQTGRYDAIDDSLVRFKDRAGRDMVLAMTHEEIVALITAHEVNSYKHLPRLIYQMQTKFRDELRSRGGLVRVREFVMKDSYSMDATQEGLQKQYEAHYDAYYRIFARLGLPIVSILSDVGMMGGSLAHEYMYVTEIGEDTIFICPGCGYKANKEVAGFRNTKEKTPLSGKAIEKIATPGVESIEDLSRSLGLDADKFGKTMFYVAELGDGSKKLVATIIRGDLDVNTVKLTNKLKAKEIRSASAAEMTAAGAAPGFASPLNLSPEKILVIADQSIVDSGELVIGANESGYHVKYAVYGRDFKAEIEADIASAYDGAPCIKCGTPMGAKRAVEAGNIFQLGTKYSLGLNAMFTDTNGERKPVIMGSYGIGVGRALACVAQEHHDNDGLKLPVTVAPYQVALIAIGNEAEIGAAEKFYADCKAAGVEVLFDDRDTKTAGPGIKFKDADLRGIPVRVTISEKSMKNGGAEIKLRGSQDMRIVPVENVLAEVKSIISDMFAKINAVADASPNWEKEKDLWK